MIVYRGKKEVYKVTEAIIASHFKGLQAFPLENAASGPLKGRRLFRRKVVECPVVMSGRTRVEINILYSPVWNKVGTSVRIQL